MAEVESFNTCRKAGGLYDTAQTKFNEAHLHILKRTNRAGKSVPRNIDDTTRFSDDVLLDDTDDDEAAPPVVEQPAIQPPAEELSQETDASRSISTSSGLACREEQLEDSDSE